jgi:hypothetical protein
MDMKPTIRFIPLFIIVILIPSACNSPAPTATATQTPAVSPTETIAPTPRPTATSEPSLTPTQTVLDLEIVEWFEYISPRKVDPSNTDTTIEILVHNPNDFPVHVKTGEMEFRLLNATGEVVYTNGTAYFSLWEGSWMLAGDSTGFQICACFQSSGLKTQKWESIELVVSLEPANDVVYTTDVEAILGEPFDIAEAHLGGSGTGIPITMTNTGDQPLGSIPIRVIARDASGRYIGMPGFGNSVVSFTENISIQPGDSLYGSLDSAIDYFDGPLTYEVVAIGIPFQATEEFALPSGTPLAEWNGIPVMPGAIGGEALDGGYQFTTAADLDAITSFYQTELSNLGFELTLNVDETAGYAILEFQKEGTSGIVAIAQLGGGLNGVVITINT